VSPEHLLRSLLICVITTMTFPIVLMGVAFGFKVVDAPISGWLCALFLAILIREIAQGGTQGITRQDLLGQYNAATIVKIRLQRLTGSGDLVEKDGRYRIVRAQNLFFIFDAVAGVIKKWIGR